MGLVNITDTDVGAKRVLVRADLEYEDRSSPRGKATDNIINYLKEKGASQIKLIGHKGIPEMRSWWEGVEINYDLRSDLREEQNSDELARELAKGWNIYINEAFGVSHRSHTSVVALPRMIKSMEGGLAAMGLRFEKEIENLSKVFDNPKSPVIVVISGLKEDKLSYVEDFLKFTDKILIGGRLPEYMQISTNKYQFQIPNEKLVLADLIADKEDITLHSVERFEKEIEMAGTIVVSGPIGKFEDEGHRLGTKRVFEAVANNKNAFKVAGGGDTEKAIQSLNLNSQFDWISVGGGAMLEFLAKRTLPGIEVLKKMAND